MMLLFALFLSATSFEVQDSVLVLNDANFKQALQDHPLILVEFYAPWCAHCQQLAPQYARAAKTLSGKGVPLSKIDAEANFKTADKEEVEGFPTIRLYQGSQWEVYQGRKSEESIVAWVLKKIQPPAQIVSRSDLAKILLKDPLNVVMYARSASKEADTFRAVSRELDGLYYYIVESEEVPCVVVYKHHDDMESHTEELEESALKAFIMKNQMKWVSEFDDAARFYIFKNRNPALFLFAKESESDLLKEVAQEVHGAIVITHVDLSENPRLAEFLEVSIEDMPFAFIFDKDRANLTLEAPLSQDRMIEFIRKWGGDRVKRGVRVLDSQSLKEVTAGQDRFVLVEFYAPWTNEHQKLTPEYAAVAGAFEQNPRVVISKINAPLNDVSIKVDESPAIFLYPANQKEGILYKGEPNSGGIIKFVRAHTEMGHGDL